jgi:hypothetical protein
MKFALFLVLIVVGVAGWSRWDASRGDGPLNRVATEIAGRPVHISCAGFFSNLVDIKGTNGEVQFGADGRPANSTTLRRWVCTTLKHFDPAKLQCVVQRTFCDKSARRTIDAIVTLTHESFHLRGVAEEARTQCYAVQKAAFTARELGASPAVADGLARWYLAYYQPDMPTEYQFPPGCYDGGKFDLAPYAGGWPNPTTR